MDDPERIYLAPECCSGPEGRCWSDYKPEADCDDGVEATEYVRADALTALQAENAKLRAYVKAFRREERRADDLATEVDRLQARIAAVETERDGARKALDYLMSDPAVPPIALDRTRQLMQHYKERGHE